MSQFLMQTTTYLNSFAATPLWTSIGWTMWHYFWIGLVELAMGCLVLGILRRSSAEMRYRFLFGLFGVLLITPLIVFQYVSRSVSQAQEKNPLVTTVPVTQGDPVTIVPAVPSEQFVEPDRMPNALQPPWKPEEAQPPASSRLLLVPDSKANQTIGQQQEITTGLMTRMLTLLIPWFPVLWIIGSPLTLLCLGLGLIGAERYRRQARIVTSGSLFEQAAQLAVRLGLRMKVLVGFSERVASPILIGIFKPLILLPVTAETGWTPAQLEMVLLHELAHVRRWDNLVNLLQRLAEGVLFFQPAIWIVSRWLTMEREHCCDALVVRVTGRAQDYATALAELAMAGHLPPGVVSAMARHPLLGRIRRILGHEQPLQVSRATLTFALTVSLCCCAMAGFVRGVDRSEKSEVVSGDSTKIEAAPDSTHEIETPQGDPGNPIDRKIKRALLTTQYRTLTAGVHTPWQVVQAIHGYKRDAKLRTRNGSTIPAIEWLATCKTFGGEALWEKTEFGGRGHPFTRPFDMEGSPTQFLGILSACDLPLDYEFKTADGSSITVQDIINDARMRVDTETDLTWTLWALVHYLPVDATWKNSKGEDWSIERLVEEVIGTDPKSSPNGRTHGLYVLAYARNQYLKSGKPLQGVWQQVDDVFKMLVATARHIQLENGSFPTGFLHSQKPAKNFDERLVANAFMLDWLVMALSDEQLQEEWVRRGIEFLADDLYENRKVAADCSPLFHAVDALNLYLHRTSKNPRPIPFPLSGKGGDKLETAGVSTDPETDLFEKRWQVVDVAGRPIPGVQVSIYSPSALSRKARRSERALIEKQSSDSAGWVTLRLPDQKDYELELAKPGFLPVKLHLENKTFCYWSPGGRRLEEESSIEMMRCGTLDVTVTGADGKPVPKYPIYVLNSFSSKAVNRDSKDEFTITDDQGKVTIHNLREGFVTFRPSKSTGLDAAGLHWAKTIPIPDGSKQNITIALSEYSSVLEGRVVSETGEGLEGYAIPLEKILNLDDELAKMDPQAANRIRRIRLNEETNRIRGANGFHFASVISDSDGRFRIQGLFPGEYVIHQSGRVRVLSADEMSSIAAPGNGSFVSFDPPASGPVPGQGKKQWLIDSQRVILKPHETTKIELVARQLAVQPLPVDKIAPDREGLLDLRAGESSKELDSDTDKENLQRLPDSRSLSTYDPLAKQNSQPSLLTKRPHGSTEQKVRHGKYGDWVLDDSKSIQTREVLFKVSGMDFKLQEAVKVQAYPLEETSGQGTDQIELPNDGLYQPDANGIVEISLPEQRCLISTSVGNSRGPWISVERKLPETMGPIPIVLKPAIPLRIRGVDPAANADLPLSFELKFIRRAIEYERYPFVRHLEARSELSLNQPAVPLFSEPDYSHNRLDPYESLIVQYPCKTSDEMRQWNAFGDYIEPGEPAPNRMRKPGYPRILDSKSKDLPVIGKSWIDLVEIVDGETEREIVLDFTKCICQVRGTIKDENGHPLAGAQIQVNRRYPARNNPEGRRIRIAPERTEWEIPVPVWDKIPVSDSKGEFTLENLQPGQVAIYALQDDEHISAPLYFELTPDRPVEAELVVDLSQSSSEALGPFSQPNSGSPGITTPISEKAPVEKDQVVTTTTGSEAIAREQLRYDGKSFDEWKEILRTEIKTDRVVEAIQVMVFFATRGYEKEAVVEVAGVLRRMPPTHALRESMEFSRVMPASATALRLLGKASIPEMIQLLKSDNLKEVVVTLEVLSTKRQVPWDWEDSLPRPSSNGDVSERIYLDPDEISKPVPVLENNPELTAMLKSLLKHPNSEVRGRILPAALGCHLPEAEIREILSAVLQDEDSAVWFSAVNFVGNSGKVRFPHDILVETYRALKESGKLQDDLLRRKYYLMLIYCDTSTDSPDAIPFLSDLISDLEVSNSPDESVLWLLTMRRFGNTSLSNEFVGREFEEKIEQLPVEEKARVQKTLDDLRILLEQHWGTKIFKKKKPGELPVFP